MRSRTVRWVVGVIASIVLLVVLRLKPWQKPMTHEDENVHTGPDIGARQSFGIFQKPIATDLNVGRELWSFANAFALLLMGLFSPFAGNLAVVEPIMPELRW